MTIPEPVFPQSCCRHRLVHSASEGFGYSAPGRYLERDHRDWHEDAYAMPPDHLLIAGNTKARLLIEAWLFSAVRRFVFDAARCISAKSRLGKGR